MVTDPKKAAGALQWAVVEMMKRYRAFSEIGVRDLASYNAHAAKTEGMEKMPQIVVVIDELADLMLVAAKEVEESICRVAQMGRAAGMHLIIATQRPSADVITGLMKAQISPAASPLPWPPPWSPASSWTPPARKSWWAGATCSTSPWAPASPSGAGLPHLRRGGGRRSGLYQAEQRVGRVLGGDHP
mgnify:CR=1 FL=1